MKSNASALPERLLKKGSSTTTRPTPSSNAMTVNRVDSPINCRMSWNRYAPITLRMPTSRARRAERAVIRFTKLMQAISKMNSAMAEKR